MVFWRTRGSEVACVIHCGSRFTDHPNDLSLESIVTILGTIGYCLCDVHRFYMAVRCVCFVCHVCVCVSGVDLNVDAEGDY